MLGGMQAILPLNSPYRPQRQQVGDLPAPVGDLPPQGLRVHIHRLIVVFHPHPPCCRMGECRVAASRRVPGTLTSADRSALGHRWSTRPTKRLSLENEAGHHRNETSGLETKPPEPAPSSLGGRTASVSAVRARSRALIGAGQGVEGKLVRTTNEARKRNEADGAYYNQVVSADVAPEHVDLAADRRGTVKDKVCEYVACGEVFTANRGHARFCSDACRASASRVRRSALEGRAERPVRRPLPPAFEPRANREATTPSPAPAIARILEAQTAWLAERLRDLERQQEGSVRALEERMEEMEGQQRRLSDGMVLFIQGQRRIEALLEALDQAAEG